MGLPTPKQLQDLGEKIAAHPINYPTFDVAYNELTSSKFTWMKVEFKLKTAAEVTASSAPGSIVTHTANAMGVASGASIGVVNVAGHTLSYTLGPLGLALSPIIAEITIAVQAGKIFQLYDIMEDAAKPSSGSLTYGCNCGKCVDNIKYIIDKKETKVAVVAVGVATLGVASAVKMVHSVVKSFEKNRPKEMTCRALVESARTKGCTAAMATIFLLSGSWTFIVGSDEKTLATAVATIISSNGWEKLKSNF